jgi:hypothetical protein
MSGVVVLVAIGVLGAVLIFAFAAAIVGEAKPLSQVIEEAATETVSNYFKSPAFAEVVKSACQSNPRWNWTVAMGRRFKAVNPSLTVAEAWDLAVRTTNEYLKDEKIAFGVAGYTWDVHGAREIADEYEIRHWEAA